ncbi:MAG: hypothetical protein AAF078_01890 [Planctomycetota bacterium]
MSAYLDGADFKSYYGTTPLTSADASAGSFTLIPEVARLTRVGNRPTSDFQTREGIFTTLGSAKRSFTLSVGYKRGLAIVTALELAFDTNAELAFALMDDAIATNGAFGVAGNYKVANINNPQDPGSTSTFEVTMEPSSFIHRYTVSA